MIPLTTVIEFLERFAPLGLAESWDNVGLLLGDRRAVVERIMTCLTITAASAAEALAEKATLIVTHHPLPFRPLQRITSDSTEGGLLVDLARGGVSVYSPHTAFDSAREGINQMLADGLELLDVAPLTSAENPEGRAELRGAGVGRRGTLVHPVRLREVGERLKRFLNIERLQLVGDPERSVSRLGIGCGSAGELIEPARRAGCDAFVTGEVRFHDCLAAESRGIALLLAGHYATERFAVEALAGILARQFSQAHVWASRREQDPIRWR